MKSAEYWDLYFARTESVKNRFDAEGISISFPQGDVHVYDHKEIALQPPEAEASAIN